MSDQNVNLREGFEQVCVMEGVHLEGTPPEAFEQSLGGMLGVRIQFLETVITLPDRDEHGQPVEDTGGRSDTLFAVHRDDETPEFDAKRLRLRLRRLEDVLSLRNHPNGRIHPERLLDYLPPLVRDLVRSGA